MLSVDRIENNIIICIDDNGNIIKIDHKKIIGKTKEGDILKKKGNKFIVDELETKKRRTKVFELQNSIFGNNN